MTTIAEARQYISCTPGIRSGRAVVTGTRIGVHDVVGLILNGATIDEVTRSYPSVSRAQVYECLSYYEDNKEGIDLLVAQQMSASE
jgi:uncharacterized protein (DUF433 family)